MTRIISLTQVFEWESMKWILLWQLDKDYGEALLEMQDDEKNKTFYYKEKKMKSIYIICVLFICLFQLSKAVFLMLICRPIFDGYDQLAGITNIAIVIGEIYSYNTLIVLIKENFPLRYEQIHHNLKMYYRFELLALSFTALLNLVFFIIHLTFQIK